MRYLFILFLIICAGCQRKNQKLEETCWYEIKSMVSHNKGEIEKIILEHAQIQKFKKIIYQGIPADELISMEDAKVEIKLYY